MRLACLLLAAGGGTRFGGRKLLAPLDGEPLLARCLAALAPRFGADLFVVLGAHRAETAALVRAPARIVANPRWRDGIGSSIARGVRVVRARGDYDGLLITLADQARLGRGDFERLLARFDGERAVAAFYAGAPGVPAIFPSALFARLETLHGDRGAKAILRQLGPGTVTVPLPRAEQDIDRVEDLGPG